MIDQARIHQTEIKIVYQIPNQDSKITNNQNKNQNNQTQPTHLAIVSKKSNNQVLYYAPFNKQMKEKMDEEVQIFHPNQWSIKDFQVGRRLGSGKYGNVYLVRERQTKMIMALKILSKRTILEEEVVFQVRRELEIHSHLKHQNILQMYGFFYNQKSLEIMIEYAAKGDLYNLLSKRKKLEESTVRRYMKQMVNAVLYLQSLNIIHRDIKPQNILISTNDTLKLSDFGWAIKTTSNQRKTFCGTPQYFCPQIINYSPFDYKVDNWSLGILAFQLLCGIPPFYDGIHKKMYENIAKRQIAFPEYTSPNFRDFVSRLTKKLPSQRMGLSVALKHPWLLESPQMDVQKSSTE